MSTNEELKKQAEEAKRDIRILNTLSDKNKEPDFANLVNEISGKKPTEIQLQAAEYWADQYLITQRKINPGLSKEEGARLKSKRKKDLIESGNLKELVDDMVRELKNPDELALRQENDVRQELKVQEIAQVLNQRDGK